MAQSELLYKALMKLWPLSRFFYCLSNSFFLRPLGGLFFKALNSEAVIVPVHETISEPENAVLPYPLLQPLIEGVDTRFLMNECMCRRGEHCQSFPESMGCLFLGEGASRIRSSMGRRVSTEEALEHVHQAMGLGLMPLVVHTSFDAFMLGIPYRQMLGICFCCDCCCTVQQGLRLGPPAFYDIVWRLPGLTVDVSRECTGCGACSGVCHVGALFASNGRMSIDRQHCKGCGRCVAACPTGAIRMRMDGTNAASDQLLDRIAHRIEIGLTGGRSTPDYG